MVFLVLYFPIVENPVESVNKRPVSHNYPCGKMFLRQVFNTMFKVLHKTLGLKRFVNMAIREIPTQFTPYFLFFTQNTQQQVCGILC